MFFPVPPLVILIPTVLPFGVQIAPSAVGLGTVFAVIMDRFIQVCLSLFHCVLALRSIIGMRQRSRNEPRKCRHHDGRHRHFSHSLNQGFLLLYQVYKNFPSLCPENLAILSTQPPAFRYSPCRIATQLMVVVTAWLPRPSAPPASPNVPKPRVYSALSFFNLFASFLISFSRAIFTTPLASS
jgi:hypothetical protein